jgi:hypothetical protein
MNKRLEWEQGKKNHQTLLDREKNSESDCDAAYTICKTYVSSENK